jgi:carotenoid cleavage dioxygenase
VEFPRFDERRTGAHHRYVYAVAGDRGEGCALVRYDVEGGSARVHRFAPGLVPGEFAFVAAAGESAQDAGWLMGFVYDASRDASALVVLDASDVAAPPVATVALPVRVPFGFHGNWIADDAV